MLKKIKKFVLDFSKRNVFIVFNLKLKSDLKTDYF